MKITPYYHINCKFFVSKQKAINTSLPNQQGYGSYKEKITQQEVWKNRVSLENLATSIEGIRSEILVTKLKIDRPKWLAFILLASEARRL